MLFSPLIGEEATTVTFEAGGSTFRLGINHVGEPIPSSRRRTSIFDGSSVTGKLQMALLTPCSLPQLARRIAVLNHLSISRKRPMNAGSLAQSQNSTAEPWKWCAGFLPRGLEDAKAHPPISLWANILSPSSASSLFHVVTAPRDDDSEINLATSRPGIKLLKIISPV